MATRALASFAVGLKPSVVPAAVGVRTQEILLDCIGNIIRARYDPAASSTPPLIVSKTTFCVCACGTRRFRLSKIVVLLATCRLHCMRLNSAVEPRRLAS